MTAPAHEANESAAAATAREPVYGALRGSGIRDLLDQQT
jgi:hypothetical protein